MKTLQNIWMILTLDCESSARLTSDSFDRDLTYAEKIAVWLHCSFCKKSRKLRRQLIAMNEKLTQLADSSDGPSTQHLSSDARDRIYRHLTEKMERDS